MIEIIKGLIDIIQIFINSIFNFQIELTTNNYVPLGYVVLSFLFILLAIYFIFKVLGIKKGDDS